MRKVLKNQEVKVLELIQRRSLQRARSCSSARCALLASLASSLPPPGPSSQQQTPIPPALAEHPLDQGGDQGGCRPPSQTAAEWRQGVSGSWSEGPLTCTPELHLRPLAALQWPPRAGDVVCAEKARSAIASGVLAELLLQPWGWALALWRNPGHQGLSLCVCCFT